jgi:MFS family permease
MESERASKEPMNAYFKVEERTFSSFEVEAPPTYVMKVIRLNPGITKQNFVCCIAHYMIMIFGFVVAGILQPLILLDKNYYNVDQDNVGTITSLVLVVQLVVKIIVSVPYGHLSDRFGRKTIIFYGALNYLISCLLVPVQTSIFPGLVLAKVLLANGTSALHCVPLLADYIADESKGRATAISAMFIGVAAILANIFLKVLFYADLTLGTCYVVIGIITFAGVMLNTLGLKGGYYSPQKPQAAKDIANNGNFKENMTEAINVFKGNGWLMIALVLSILGSSDFFVFFTFLALYVKSMFPPGTEDAVSNIAVNNLQTLVMLPSFFCNLFYGYYLDKPNKAFHVSLFALGGGTFSFILISMSDTPYDWKLKFASVIMGSTIPGLLVIGNYLGFKNFPQNKRGIMIGFTGLAGYIGFFIIASGGGFLYDHWRKDAPFIICSVLLILALLVVLRIHKVMIASK